MRFTKSALLCAALAAFALYAANEGSGFDRTNFDQTCKPCEDFWRYANGGWIDRNPVPKRLSSWGTMPVIREANDERLRILLEAAAKSKAPANSNERKIGDFYAACMDTATIDARGLQPLQPHLDRLAKVKSVAELAAFVSSIQNELPIGPAMLFAGQDRKNSAETIANVAIMMMSLPERDYYLSTDERQKKLRAEFVTHVAKMFELMGDAPDAAKRNADFVLAFETKFAEVALTRVQMRDPYATYHPMKFAELASLTPRWDWTPLFQLSGVALATPINVMHVETAKLFNAQLEATPIDGWKTWMRWRLLTASADLLAKRFADEDFRFSRTILAGVKEQQPRWQVCAGEVDQKLGEALGQLFVQKHFPPAAKQRMMELVNNLKATLGEELRNAEWLSPETRAQAVKKLEAFTPKIGYPDKWRDYSAVKIDRKRFVESIQSANAVARKRNMAKIGKPLDKTE